ncbi:hypothetical protein FRC05_005160 [Tulasnella sp. 425]|nr:hypothetical protein FRC05_005160 [Tulasnella sp. 425]
MEVLADRIPYAEKSQRSIIVALMKNERPSDANNLPIPIQALKDLLANFWAIEPKERPSAGHCLRVLATESSALKLSTHLDGVTLRDDGARDFLPDHDLDKSSIDEVQIANEGLPSFAGKVLPPPVSVPVSVSKEAKSIHRKSIRVVAKERKKVLERVGPAQDPSSKATILRRKSTKLWGNRVEEVTPGQTKSGLPKAAPELPTEPAPRLTIKWVKGEMISRGTYGRVYLALNATTGEMMAVKQVEMPQASSNQDDLRQVSVVEALEAKQKTLEKLGHPNVVQYLGSEKTEEFFSIFLGYVPGGSIGGCLRQHGRFEENIIKSFTGQVIDGLAYLHANKIIHRDIKADSILVDPAGSCKICSLDSSEKREEVYSNVFMPAISQEGSILWMAPEMLYNDRGYSAKADIWSLGCTVIEMFTGERPWGQGELVSVALKVGYIVSTPQRRSSVPEAEDFPVKCFTQDPDERPTAEGLKGHSWLSIPPGWIFMGFQ